MTRSTKVFLKLYRDEKLRSLLLRLVRLDLAYLNGSKVEMQIKVGLSGCGLCALKETPLSQIQTINYIEVTVD